VRDRVTGVAAAGGSTGSGDSSGCDSALVARHYGHRAVLRTGRLRLFPIISAGQSDTDPKRHSDNSSAIAACHPYDRAAITSRRATTTTPRGATATARRATPASGRATSTAGGGSPTAVTALRYACDRSAAGDRGGPHRSRGA